MSWIDTALSIGSMPDWISPALNLYRNLTRPHVVICFSGMSVNEAKRRLKRAGIQRWGDYIVDGYGYISVPPEDADEAMELLCD